MRSVISLGCKTWCSFAACGLQSRNRWSCTLAMGTPSTTWNLCSALGILTFFMKPFEWWWYSEHLLPETNINNRFSTNSLKTGHKMEVGQPSRLYCGFKIPMYWQIFQKWVGHRFFFGIKIQLYLIYSHLRKLSCGILNPMYFPTKKIKFQIYMVFMWNPWCWHWGCTVVFKNRCTKLRHFLVNRSWNSAIFWWTGHETPPFFCEPVMKLRHSLVNRSWNSAKFGWTGH